MKIPFLAMGLLALAPSLVPVAAGSPRPPSGASAPAHDGADAGYWEVVERYREGGHEEALAGLAELPPDAAARAVMDVADLTADAERCTRCPPREKLRERPLLAAVMLHTDRAWQGQIGNVVDLRAATSLLGAARLDPGNEDFARRWYLAVTLKAYASTDGTLALRMGHDGLDLFPEDPHLLLAVGSLEEALATPTSGGPLAQQGAPLDASHLREAQKELAAAAASELTMAPALVRLGRVQALLGQREASQTLARALDAAIDPRLVYLARLYLGSVEEEAGHPRRAAEHYGKAVAAVPAGQAARIALSQVLRREGDVSAARRALDTALVSPPRARDADPYWVYPWGRSAEADRLLDELRSAAR